MALRRSVLTTHVGGIPDLVRLRENDLLFPAGSIDTLTAAIEDFLAKPSDELRKIGDAGHLRFVERHSIDMEMAKLGGDLRESCP